MSDRKKILINPNFQLKILNLIAGLYLLISVLFYFANLYVFHKFHQYGLEAGLDKADVYFHFVDGMNKTSNFAFLIVFILGIILIYSVGFYISHKIAGPIYNIQKSIKEITTQKNSDKKILFRSGDFFPELSESINSLIEYYKNK